KIKELDIKALMIHGRSMSQGRTGEIDWEIIKEAKNRFNGIVLANGGITDAKIAKDLLEKTGVDGLGIARGALGRPWIFSQLIIKNYQLSIKDIYKVALRHAKLAYKLKGDAGIREMRKHLCWYAAGLPGAAELRGKLVKVESLAEIKKILK
ncbi:MAG: tRNA-dihydrouridine synthase, partial [Patescibacteria group bacterium]